MEQSNAVSFSKMLKKCVLVVFIAATAAFVVSSSKATPATTADGSSAATIQTPTTSPERFDYIVRGDFFAGMAGDQARFERAMKVCEDALARNPNHAEALVWHGGGLVWLAGQAFQKSDIRKGTDLWDRGLNEMDRAVELQPNNVAVLIPRGAVLLPASRFVPNATVQRALLEKAVGDYERVLELQNAYFSKLSSHARGELLFGLAEGSARLGRTDKARVYFQRIVTECKDSGREKQAAAWLEKGVLTNTNPMSCSGCHTK